MYGPEAKAISAIAFASTVKRQTLPVWLRLPLVGAAVAAACWLSILILSAADNAPGGAGTVLTILTGCSACSSSPRWSRPRQRRP